MKDQFRNPSPVRTVIHWMGGIALCSLCAGTYLLARGYESGQVLFTIVSTTVGALGGMISVRGQTPTTSSGAIATEVTNPPEKPVPTEQK